MDVVSSCTNLLGTLHVSPFYRYDVPPSLWVLTGEDPVLATPFMSFENMTAVTMLAQHWRSAEGTPDVPFDTLALLVEGTVPLSEGVIGQVRECLVVTRDGQFAVLRQQRADGSIAELDTMEYESEAAVAVREVAASAWPA